MFAKDLTPFYEPVDIKPLLHGHIVKSGEHSYRVERTFWSTEGVRAIGCQRKKHLTKEDFLVKPERIHCYVFIDITMNTQHRKNPFAKKPSTVVELLKSKKIEITNFPY